MIPSWRPGADLDLLAERAALASHLTRGGKLHMAVLAVEVHPTDPTETVEPEAAPVLDRIALARIESVLARGDSIARLAPLSYAVLLQRREGAGFATRAADDIVNVIHQPFAARRDRSPLVASVGISVFPDDGSEFTELFRCAEAAEQAARLSGGDLFGFFSGSLSEAASRRMAIERALPEALDRQHLCLFYQPQLDTRDGSLVGVEALLRWHHPTLGAVPPMEFVPVLESVGLIARAGLWVLETACAQGASWVGEGRPVRVSINVSALQLLAGGFEHRVEDVLARTGLPPRWLELELTETLLLSDEPHVRQSLTAIRALGVRLALDDFGTGYASLAYIRQFPLDTIKIDRQFIRGLPVDPQNVAITSSIVALARCLALGLVAEGVETEAEEEFLHSVQCYVVQGYRYARPMPPEDLERWRLTRPWA